MPTRLKLFGCFCCYLGLFNYCYLSSSFVGYSLLSRSDIGMVVETGTPFLFKSALNTTRRMRAFLGIGAGNVSLIMFVFL